MIFLSNVQYSYKSKIYASGGYSIVWTELIALNINIYDDEI